MGFPYRGSSLEETRAASLLDFPPRPESGPRYHRHSHRWHGIHGVCRSLPIRAVSILAAATVSQFRQAMSYNDSFSCLRSLSHPTWLPSGTWSSTVDLLYCRHDLLVELVSP